MMRRIPFDAESIRAAALRFHEGGAALFYGVAGLRTISCSEGCGSPIKKSF